MLIQLESHTDFSQFLKTEIREVRKVWKSCLKLFKEIIKNKALEITINKPTG